MNEPDEDLCSLVEGCLKSNPLERIHKSSLINHPAFSHHHPCNKASQVAPRGTRTFPSQSDTTASDNKGDKNSSFSQQQQWPNGPYSPPGAGGGMGGAAGWDPPGRSLMEVPNIQALGLSNSQGGQGRGDSGGNGNGHARTVPPPLPRPPPLPPLSQPPRIPLAQVPHATENQ